MDTVTVETTKQRLGDLCHHLKRRGYNDKVIESGLSKASEINRNNLRSTKKKGSTNGSPCLTLDIAKYLKLLSCRLAMEHLCVLQLETAPATLVTTWFTLADRRSGSRYRSFDPSLFRKKMQASSVIIGKKLKKK
jgi:hypothetical protein